MRSLGNWHAACALLSCKSQFRVYFCAKIWILKYTTAINSGRGLNCIHANCGYIWTLFSLGWPRIQEKASQCEIWSTVWDFEIIVWYHSVITIVLHDIIGLTYDDGKRTNFIVPLHSATELARAPSIRCASGDFVEHRDTRDTVHSSINDDLVVTTMSDPEVQRETHSNYAKPTFKFTDQKNKFCNSQNAPWLSTRQNIDTVFK